MNQTVKIDSSREGAPNGFLIAKNLKPCQLQ